MALLFYTTGHSYLVPVSSASGNNDYVVNVLALLQGDNTDGQVTSSSIPNKRLHTTFQTTIEIQFMTVYVHIYNF